MNSLPLNIALAAPTPTLATSTTGGSLAAATYFYKIVAKLGTGAGGTVPGTTFNGIFNTAAGTEASQVTTGTTSTVTVTIPSAGAATAYDIYRSTATGTEVYLTTVTPAAYGASTVFVDTGAITPGTTTAASITASTRLPGNSFAPGGTAGALSNYPAGSQYIGAPAGTPFIAGRSVVVANMSGSSVTLTQYVDATTAGTTWLTVPANSMVDTSNVIGNGVGGLPNYLVASAAGCYLLGSP